MDRIDLTGARWQKSSYSNANQNCVEVASGIIGAVPVRDSKRPEGGALILSAAAWFAFTDAVRDGRL
ncbi:DUF397 domain-containing protein [Streptomyces sp. P38-E01]|uniref:DUF397 domain-containing protein n=1 Tax=Streptomyces tardus TaxID=2780544 RepID=A0A949JDV3_9ACTN|nr:DUF397 domain-containing protein [Streptomyces tardus]MBU7597627.1 DUF397 domain-containing protein [Streptomyces tardus]